MTGQLRYFASVPYPQVSAEMEKLAGAGLGIEIELTDPHWLLELVELPAVKKLGRALAERGIGVQVQGPFYDLAPGSLDPYIRDHTLELFRRTVEIAGALGAGCATFYTGYNPLLHSGAVDQWLEICRSVWTETVEAADRFNLRVLFANMFEDSPEVQLRLIESVPAGAGGACLDVANTQAASRRKITSWVGALSANLQLVHLSDSRGREGGHRQAGSRKLPLREFYDACVKKNLEPDIVFKMDADRAVQSLQAVRRQGLGQYQMELL